MVSHWSFNDCKSFQVSRNFLSILSDLNNAVVWMVSYPLISMSYSSLLNFWGLPQVYQPYLVSLSPSCSIEFNRFFFFVLLTITWSGRLAATWWSVCISKSQKNLCATFSRTFSKLCIKQLFGWSNLNFLHNTEWIPFSPSRV